MTPIHGPALSPPLGAETPFGKVQAPLGQLRLHDLADERIRAAAAKAGKPVLEFCRDFLEVGFCREELLHGYSLYLGELADMQPKRNSLDR